MNSKLSKSKNIFTAKIQHLHLKAPSNNVKIQSEETLLVFYFSLLQSGWDFKLMRLGNKLTKKKQ